MGVHTNISGMSRDGSAHQHASKHASISRYRAPVGLQIIACMDPCSYVAWLVPLRGLTAHYCAPMGLQIIACTHSSSYFAWLASLRGPTAFQREPIHHHHVHGWCLQGPDCITCHHQFNMSPTVAMLKGSACRGVRGTTHIHGPLAHTRQT